MTTPPEGKCRRCQQTRPLFHYTPLHDCVRDAGSVDLVEAASWIAAIEDNNDVWCEARIERRLHKPSLCVRCFEKEPDVEQRFIDECLEG